MDEDAVHAYGEKLNTQFMKFLMLIGDRRYFGCSDKGEVARIETEDDPLLQVLGKFH